MSLVQTLNDTIRCCDRAVEGEHELRQDCLDKCPRVGSTPANIIRTHSSVVEQLTADQSVPSSNLGGSFSIDIK